MKLLNILSSSSALLTTLLLSTIPLVSVSAHGVVHRLLIDGKEYLGNLPNADPQPSVIRQVADVGPVKGTSNPDTKCGLSAKPASDVAEANPGSTLQFDWRGGNLATWPHNTGPMMTYMASCGSVTCDKFDPTNAEWFLIDRQGLFPNGSWAQVNLQKGAMVVVQIPSNLKPGNYMVRHEIVALHLAVTKGGAEFYPSCSQLHVGGSQTGAPQQSDLVNFPGAYKDDDPGIFDPDVFNPGANYTFPGPNVASFISGSGSGSSSSGNNSTSGSNSGKNSGSGSSSGKKCKLRRKDTSGSNSGGDNYSRRALGVQFHRRQLKSQPRSFSRIMRDIFY